MLSGVVSVVLLTLIRKLIVEAKNPLSAGLVAMPIIYGLATFVNVLTVTMNGSKREKLKLLRVVECNKFSFSHAQCSAWRISSCGKSSPSALER